jgi:hypothetical protein
MKKMLIDESVRIDGFIIRTVNAEDITDIETLTAEGDWHIGEANLRTSTFLVIDVSLNLSRESKDPVSVSHLCP